MTTQCSMRVYGGSVRGHPCTRTAKHEYEGAAYCGTHYPPNVTARTAMRHAEREAEWRRKNDARLAAERRQREIRHKAYCFDSLLAALKEVVALSDRKHNAWDKAHAAIKRAEGKS